ncbi:hypothetical protein ACIQ1J_31055 [Streptomyces sp. NPDC097107]|uniref:hypothetical protein n=1 Tax=Streptomyces sp. NPDC097107 TaxID=3366089 RepID=UPI003819B04D
MRLQAMAVKARKCQAFRSKRRCKRRQSIQDLRARDWAEHPTLTGRLAAVIALGELAIHHQDIVRGLGLDGEPPPAVPSYILWVGALLSSHSNLRVWRYRVVPTDGHPPLGVPQALRPPEVLGTREALGMWLAGRDAAAGELHFTSSPPTGDGGRDPASEQGVSR